MTLAFLGLALGPLIVMWVISPWQGFVVTRRTALAAQRRVVERVARYAGHFVERLETDLIVLGGQLEGLEADERRDALSELLGRHDYLADVVLADAQGQEQLRVVREGITITSDLRHLFDKAALLVLHNTGRPFCGPAVVENGESLLTVAVPLRDTKSGQIDRILATGVRLMDAWRIISETSRNEGDRIYLADARQRIVAHPSPSVVLTDTSLTLPMKDDFLTLPDGTRVLTAVEPVRLGGRPFTVVAERDSSRVFASFSKTLFLLFAVSAVIVGLAVVVGIVMVRRIVQPIQDLSAVAKAVEAGDLSRQAEVTSRDEIGELAEAFNRMTARLRETLEILEREVADRKSVTRELQHSCSVLSATLESTADGILVIDNEGRIAHFNQRFVDMWQVPEDLMATRDAGKVLEAVSGQLSFPEVYRDQVQILYEQPQGISLDTIDFKDGRVFEQYSQPHRIEGQTVGRLFSFRDITQAKRADRALRESEQRFRAIFESAHDGIFLKDLDHRYTHVNPGMERIFGIPAAELIGHTSDEFAQMHGGVDIRAVDDRVLAGEVVEAEDKRTVNGQKRTFHVVKAPMKDSTGQVIGLCGITRDVTARKKAEEALRESEHRYRLLAENVTDVIWTMDLDMRFTYISPSVTAMEGYTVEEAMARSLDDYMPPESLEQVQKTYAEEMAKENMPDADTTRSPVLELQQRRKDGSLMWVEINVTFLRDENGRVIGFLGVTRDITRRREAEEERKRLLHQLQQTDKLESLAVLAGGIAHDFNNLLMGILGYARFALEDLPPDSPLREGIVQIEKAGMRAAELANQMLAYSGKGLLAIEMVRLGELLEDIRTRLEGTVSENAVLKYDLADDLPYVQGDATQIRQIIIQLITNASEALDDGEGEIIIRTGLVEADRSYLAETYLDDELPAGEYVYVEVTDTGCGMDQEMRSKIFDPFFTTKFTGRGLGLAAVLGIVRAHRGAIRVESEVGRGTTFRILLPSTGARAPQEAPVLS